MKGGEVQCVCVCVCVCASCEKPSATADYFSALYVCVYTRTLQKTLVFFSSTDIYKFK